MQYADVMAPAQPDPHFARRYAQDLWELRTKGRAQRIDRVRAQNLSVALCMLHHQRSNPSGYCRALTRALSSEEGIPRCADWIDEDHPILRPERLERMEVAIVHWRWLLRDKRHRNSLIHGSLTPENIYFRGEECTLLEVPLVRGEPAQDVAAITLRYIVAALLARGRFEGAPREVWEEFWSSYLTESDDLEMLEVIPPFYAREVLELIALDAPDPLPEQVQHHLIDLAELLLAGRPFRPDHLDGMLP